MPLFEFIVDGPPVSQQTRRRERLHEWKRVVRAVAQSYWPVGQAAFDGALRVTILYFFEGAPVDIDNIVKPIHDSLTGLVYHDDMQVSDSISRRRDLDGQFSIRDLSPTLAAGLDRHKEFLYVAVDPAPARGELD